MAALLLVVSVAPSFAAVGGIAHAAHAAHAAIAAENGFVVFNSIVAGAIPGAVAAAWLNKNRFEDFIGGYWIAMMTVPRALAGAAGAWLFSTLASFSAVAAAWPAAAGFSIGAALYHILRSQDGKGDLKETFSTVAYLAEKWGAAAAGALIGAAVPVYAFAGLAAAGIGLGTYAVATLLAAAAVGSGAKLLVELRRLMLARDLERRGEAGSAGYIRKHANLPLAVTRLALFTGLLGALLGL